MHKIKLFTDSTSDLPKDLAKKLDIGIIPLSVTLGDKTYPDDGSLTCDDLFDFVDKTDTLPKTSAINTMDFVEAFKPWLEKDYDIAIVTISSELSSTCQNAIIAANELNATDRIFVINSRSLSSGISLAAYKMAKLRDQGKSASEIKTIIDQDIVPKISASFFVPTLDYLYKGGRCSKLSAYIGTKLKLSPQLLLIDGLIVPGEKFRGNWKKVCDTYFEAMVGDGKDIDKSIVFITHTANSKQNRVQALADLLKEEYGFTTVITNNAGATIASHCGPNTLGVLFIKK